MKKIMILGGGENQLPLISRAKLLGYYVVLCDFRDNMPGIKMSDIHYKVNTLNANDVISVGKKEGIDGIITNSEPTFISMAEIAGALNLRCMTMDQTLLYKNKYLMRVFCQKKGILTPAFRQCSKIEEAISFFESLGKKCIIKPLDNSASRGVFSIKSVDDIRMHFDETLNASSKSNPYVLIEEYITGTEFTIDGIMTPNGHRCLAISEKKHYAYNENVAYQLLFENHNRSFDYDKLRAVNDKLVNITNINFGLTHAEYKYHNGEFYLIEIQARGGGNFIATDIVPYISGIDSYTKLIQWSVGEDVEVYYDYARMNDRCSVLYFFDSCGRKGVVQAVEGLDYLDSLKGKLFYELFFKPGDTIGEAKDDASRIGYYILKADSREELDEIMSKIDDKFRIVM